MSECYYVVVEGEKVVYELGTMSAAATTFPLLLKKELPLKEFILFGDETHSWLEDKYLYNPGYEQKDYSFYYGVEKGIGGPTIYFVEAFSAVFNQAGGKPQTKKSINSLYK